MGTITEEKITSGNKEFSVFIIIERRNNTRVSIGKKGIYIRVPSWLSRDKRNMSIIQMKQWARKKLADYSPPERKKCWKKYNNEDIIKLGNDEYVINISNISTKGCKGYHQNNKIFIKISEFLNEEQKNEAVSVLLSRIIGKIKYNEICQRIKKLNNEHFGFEYRKVSMKYNVSNWGSCSGNQNINISTRLLFAPEDVRDYVLVHEIAHLKEKNHSSKFWELVAKAVPDYKEKSKWLKENSDKCWF